ncbi:MAG: DUF366 family protein [Deltaproteobacteria bacterium]|nr:DUF366 family protein [Deltaproteobacteria bacterium]
MELFQVRFLEEALKYDGTQLAPLWIYKNYNIQGNALVSFIGPADVPLKHMVDVEDVKAQSPIYSESMVHFLGEFFDLDLEKTVFRQRLLMATVKEVLEKKISRVLSRQGDDVYDGDAKLSVSIATLSSLSTLIHAGINISSRNTPVKTKSLADYDVAPHAFAKEVLELFKKELESSWLARCKVRPV